MKYRYSLITLFTLSSLNAQNISLDAISITATKISTGTKEVSQSIAVVDEKTIEDKNILNIQEAIENIPGVNAESSTNSPSPRLIIRGAGLKARYGVREVMVMKDGVPLTDPDSFTRFDFIDIQDVSSIEVQKGPGSINAANATGGVIQLITKSVFEEDKNRIKLGVGDDGQRNLNLKVRSAISENDFASVTFSKRKIDNSWRDNNNFDATQLSLKYGHFFEDDSSVETELSYTESNMKIPTAMTAEEFAVFKNTGEQHNTSAQFQHSSRDSKIFALNVKYEKEVGEITYKPRFYFNTWDHFHPVTGLINESDNNSVYGTDLELNYNHNLFGNKASLVAGVTLKTDITKDAKKYEYADYVILPASGWPFSPYISETLSDNKGDLAQTEDSTTTLYGAYLMETFSPINGLRCDISTRVDKLSFDISGNEITAYDYSIKNYTDGIGEYSIDKSYKLISSRFGATYKLTETTNVYLSVATANQAPTTSELGENESLEKSTSLNYEVGVKTRAQNISFDFAIYQNDVDDEIIQILDANGNSVYDNAGKTQKRGLEFNGVYKLSNNLDFGGSYAFSDFKFKKFNEKVGAVLVSRDTNHLPYIPKNQYSLFAAFNMDNGFKSRITTKSWGSYYMDNANTKKYEGFKFATDLMIGYTYKSHNIQLNIKNITNKYYAMEALKDVYGNESYKAAAPMSVMLTYSYLF
ncbi:TonB-dependent receptor [Candidatus Sulfurimonas marisnigri]|uniref:TonB-dependent receptor n=1 Tax=Candidatus Sulfurimonas marisnigri TaxID=2740405 RepID=A0A7S7M2C2_9BACT|nr:TonB-dependent receptor [Candidatus Sulfurimonas marisnigri]QOY55735.1 TonB-dependent receptor [Candidatus Sulfurimonas marisnigri]